jgi:hypothetical protein
MVRGAAANAAGHGYPDAAKSSHWSDPSKANSHAPFFTLCYVGEADIPRGLGVSESPDPLVISGSGGFDILHRLLFEGPVDNEIHNMTVVTVT